MKRVVLTIVWVALAIPALSRAGTAVPYLFIAKKGDQSMYVLGTRHSGVSLSEYPDYVREAVEHSTVAVTELKKPNFVGKACQMFLAASTLINFSKGGLRSQLSAESWQKLVARFTKNGLPEKLINRLTPLAAMVMIDEDFSRSEAGELDDEIVVYAHNHRLKLEHLETANQQKKMIQSFSTVQNLEDMLKAGEKETAADKKDRKLKEFKSGDFSLLEASLQAMDPNTRERISFSRNREWIPRILSLKGRPFIAVGALHLPGEQGVLKLLEAQGYTITRVQSSVDPK